MLALALLAARALAQETSPTEPVSPDTSAPSTAELSEATKKPDEEKRRTDIAVLPGINFSTEAGFGFGLNAAIFVRDKGFRPFRYAAKLQLFATTRGVQDHSLVLDAPTIAHTPFRPQFFLGFFRDPIRPFFGIGNTTQVAPGLSASSKELQYTLTSLYVGFMLEYRLTPAWRLTLLYDLRTLNMDVKAGTLLAQENPTGTGGGRSGRVDLELLYDTRDVETSPTRGVYLALSGHLAGTLLGSTFDYGGVTGEAHGYWSPGALGPKLVLAGRLLGDVTGGDVPVALLPLAGGRTRVEMVGGSTSVRGLPRYRYLGKGKLLANGELRSRFHRFTVFKRPLDLWGVAFVDTGRVWAQLKSDGPFWNFHTGEGAGLRLAWVEDFVVRIDVAHSEGTWGFYGVLDHMF